MLDAVLLATILIGTSLPFDAGQTASLWDGPAVEGAALARMAALLLVIVLVAIAISDANTWTGAAQLVASGLVVFFVASLANSTEPAAGPGATLVVVTALVSAAVGACAMVIGVTERKLLRGGSPSRMSA